MLRIGHAWDTHRLVENRKLILGGIEFGGKVGLLGHSDADVVLHAIAESLLGSLALGDLGCFYPDDKDETLNLDSRIILKECYQRVLKRGYSLNNLDVTIYAEKIKIAPKKDEIRKSIADILEVDINRISIKATTWEKMGFVGREEAIASECVCLVSDNSDMKLV